MRVACSGQTVFQWDGPGEGFTAVCNGRLCSAPYLAGSDSGFVGYLGFTLGLAWPGLSKFSSSESVVCDARVAGAQRSGGPEESASGVPLRYAPATHRPNLELLKLESVQVGRLQADLQPYAFVRQRRKICFALPCDRVSHVVTTNGVTIGQ